MGARKTHHNKELDGAGDGGRTRDVQLGKTTVNWKQRTLRFLHLVLAIENTPVFTRCSAQLANGAQMEHNKRGSGDGFLLDPGSRCPATD
jgi:hypothetical protein